MAVLIRRLDGAGGATLVLLSDPAALAGAAEALVQAQHLRTLTRISPAVRMSRSGSGSPAVYRQPASVASSMS